MPADGELVHRPPHLPHPPPERFAVGQPLGQAHGGGIVARFVAGLQVGDRPLRPLQQLAQLPRVEAAGVRGVGMYLRAVDRLHRQVHQLQRDRCAHGAPEQRAHAAPVLLVEAPERVVVGVLPARQPEAGQLVAAGRLELAAGADVGHEAVEPHAQQRARVVGGSAHRLPVEVHAQFGPLLPIERVHELGHEAGGMVGGDQFVERWRQQPHLVPGHLAKRHRSAPHVIG